MKDVSDSIRKSISKMPTRDLVERMLDDRYRKGSYRPEDVFQLLGDPNVAVTSSVKNSSPPSSRTSSITVESIVAANKNGISDQ